MSTAPARPFGAWERAIAMRYLRAKRAQGGVAMISIISFIGITLAVAVLIIVMSVMNGFRTELLTRMLGFNGHIYVSGPIINGPDRQALTDRLRSVPRVVSAMPVVEAQGLAMGPNGVSFAVVRGLRPADVAATRIVSGNIKEGSLKGFGEGEYGGDLILVGQRLAQTLGVRIGDELTLLSPTGGATAFGSAPRRKSYTVGAIFSVGVSEYDAAFIYMPLEQAQLFFGRDQSVDLLEVNLADPDTVDKAKPEVASAAGPGAMVTDWRDRNHSVFSSVQIEKKAMGLILSMLVIIAAMNIISGLIMLVKNKSRDIGILRTMGASQSSILRIFFMAGATIGAAGTTAGVLIGVLFCTFISPIQSAVEWMTGVSVFNPDTYYLSRLPARVDWNEVVSIILFALIMSFVWTLPPAWRASRLDPVEALRYE